MMQSQTVYTSQGPMVFSQSMANGQMMPQPVAVTSPQVTQQQACNTTHVITTGTGPQTVVAPVVTHTNISDKYTHHAAIGLGITQIIVGVVCICMNIMALYTDSRIGESVGYGFWNGIFFIITGSLGVASGFTKNTCMIVGCMVLAILSASIFVPCLVITAGVDIFLTWFYNLLVVDLVAPVMLLFLGILEFILAIAAAVICCQVVCCGQQHRGGVVWPTTTQYITTTSQQQQQPVGVSYVQSPAVPTVTPTYQQPVAPFVGPSSTGIPQAPAYSAENPTAYVTTPNMENRGFPQQEKY